MLPQYRLRSCGQSPCNIRDDRPFRNCTSLAGANCGGATTNMWTWSGETGTQNPNLPRRADLPEHVSRTLCDLAPQHLVPRRIRDEMLKRLIAVAAGVRGPRIGRVRLRRIPPHRFRRRS
jgi:hypothetical protein